MYFLVTVHGSCNLPNIVVAILHEAYNIIRYLIPVGIVLFGTIDFLKAIMGKDDKDINSKLFVKRLLYGLLAFFVFSLVKWVFTILSNAGVGGASSAFQCASNILSGNNGTIIQPGRYESNEECCNQNYATCISNNQNSPNKEQECIEEAQNKCKSNCSNINSNSTTTSTKAKDNGSSGGNNLGGNGSGGHRDDTLNTCITNCKNANQSVAYCQKHCDTEMNGGSQ